MINRLSTLDYNKQLVRLLTEAKLGSSVVNVVGPLIYFYVFFNTIPLYILISWVLIQITIFAFRMKVGFELSKILEFKSSSIIKKYLSIYLVLIFINAVMWGISAIPALMYGNQLQIIILTIAIFAILSGSILTLTHVFHAVFIYIIGIIPIFIAALIIVGASQVHYLIALSLLLYSLGAISAAYMLHLYMSDSIEKNEEIALLNRQLKQKVENAVKDAKRMEIKLYEQSRLAQMGEMISMIAHQWRQPLGAISSTSIDLSMKMELETFDLKEEQGREECQDYFVNGLGEINGFVQNLTNTIDDFRNFYKPNKKSALISVREPIQKALNIVKPSFVSEGIEIVESCTCDKSADMFSNEIMQVILNILKNAQDNFNEKAIKNPKITITSECNLGNTNTLKIADNGGGIAEDIIHKIFDPYFSTKSEKNGSGLGLYMSKIIIEDHHNGTLTAQNRDDGVCFTIELGIILEK